MHTNGKQEVLFVSIRVHSWPKMDFFTASGGSGLVPRRFPRPRVSGAHMGREIVQIETFHARDGGGDPLYVGQFAQAGNRPADPHGALAGIHFSSR